MASCSFCLDGCVVVCMMFLFTQVLWVSVWNLCEQPCMDVFMYMHMQCTHALCVHVLAVNESSALLQAELRDRDQQQPCFSSSCSIQHDSFSSKNPVPKHNVLKNDRYKASERLFFQFWIWSVAICYILYRNKGRKIISLMADLVFSHYGRKLVRRVL